MIEISFVIIVSAVFVPTKLDTRRTHFSLHFSRVLIPHLFRRPSNKIRVIIIDNNINEMCQCLLDPGPRILDLGFYDFAQNSKNYTSYQERGSGRGFTPAAFNSQILANMKYERCTIL